MFVLFLLLSVRDRANNTIEPTEQTCQKKFQQKVEGLARNGWGRREYGEWIDVNFFYFSYLFLFELSFPSLYIILFLDHQILKLSLICCVWFSRWFWVLLKVKYQKKEHSVSRKVLSISLKKRKKTCWF